MLACQMIMYWLKPMYAQKQVNAKMSEPTLCTCPIFRCEAGRLGSVGSTSASASMQKAERNAPAK